MAADLTEAIVSGQIPVGEALPTEPELADRFGVSRAVVRDATRMLAARGLVDAQHGRGVFVTESPVGPFGDALLLALRRAGATVWDVERFEQMILPEVAAEAAREATDEDLSEIRRLADVYVAQFDSISRRTWGQPNLSTQDQALLMSAFRAFYGAIFAATHNAVWALLAEPLMRLRAPRNWDTGDATVDELVDHERRVMAAYVDAIASRDPDRARADIAAMVTLPTAAETAMRSTPVGQVAKMDIPLPGFGATATLSD
jgi:DNA-binding FadR family transcriptional regulator